MVVDRLLLVIYLYCLLFCVVMLYMVISEFLFCMIICFLGRRGLLFLVYDNWMFGLEEVIL